MKIDDEIYNRDSNNSDTRIDMVNKFLEINGNLAIVKTEKGTPIISWEAKCKNNAKLYKSLLKQDIIGNDGYLCDLKTGKLLTKVEIKTLNKKGYNFYLKEDLEKQYTTDCLILHICADVDDKDELNNIKRITLGTKEDIVKGQYYDTISAKQFCNQSKSGWSSKLNKDTAFIWFDEKQYNIFDKKQFNVCDYVKTEDKKNFLREQLAKFFNQRQLEVEFVI